MKFIRSLLTASVFLTVGGLFMSSPDTAFSQTPDPISTLSAATGGRPRTFTFVQLVFESRWIAVGTVISTSSDGATPTLSIERSFPAGLPRQLRVVSSSSQVSRGASVLSFSEGETLVLFLEDVEQADGALLGIGDVGKWPRWGADWMFTAGHVRPISEVVKAVELLLKVNARKTYEERVDGLLNELMPAGSLGQIAAAQYAADYERWNNVQSAGEIGLTEVQLLVATKFLLAIDQRDPAVNYAVLQLLARAPSSISIPYLIDRLNDPDTAMRDTAFASLQTAALPYTNEKFGYKPSDSSEQRSLAINKWQAWWASQQSIHLRQEVPKMLADLNSPNQLRRLIADSSLQLLSGRKVGYQENAPADQRHEAVSRWKAWWLELSLYLK